MSNYTPEQIANFILQHIETPEVKEVLKRNGVSVVPNSKALLFQKLEAAGYKVIKKDEYDKLIQNEKPVTETGSTTHTEPITESIPEMVEHQFLGAKPPSVEPTPSDSQPKSDSPEPEKRRITDPFGGDSLTKETVTTNHGNRSTSNSPTGTAMKEKGVQEFNHYKEVPSEPESPIEKTWHQIRLQAKSKSISFYSLVANAILLQSSDEEVVIGFSTHHTYQMNQLKKGDNLSTLQSIVENITGKTPSIQIKVVDEGSLKRAEVLPKQVSHQLFGSRG